MKTESPLLHIYSALLLSLILPLLHNSSSSDSFYDLNVDCGPHQDIVVTDGVSFRFIPYYVQLNRCQGKNIWGDATAEICFPTRIDKVKFKAEDRYTPGTIRDIIMENHTACVFACPRNETFCRANQTWNPATCSCCSRRNNEVCAKNSRWSEKYCSCVAEKKIEIEELPATKKSTEPRGIKVKYIIVIVVAELIILTAVSFIIFCLCCQKWSKEREKDRRREEKELIWYDEKVTTNTVMTNGCSVTNNRDSFTYNVDKDQRRFVVSGGHGNFIATVVH